MDKDKGWADFGVNLPRFEGKRRSGIITLSEVLLMFEDRTNRIDEIVASFVAICEKNLRDRGLCSETEQT